MADRNRVNGPAKPRRSPSPGAPAPEAASSGTARPRRPPVGQNFLADRAAAEKIVAALGDISHSAVLEIGPGRGALTDPLARRAAALIAIELDRVLAAQLRMRYAALPQVEIIEGDILAVDLQALFSTRRGFWGGPAPTPLERVRVVGNIPYYITSDILLRLLEFHERIQTIVILVQREVADRIAAAPGQRDYGLLSATVQLYARVEKLFTLPPGAFSPPPRVHSTALRLTVAPQAERLRISEREFLDFLKLSFAHKRKTLSNNLKTRYPESAILQALAAAGLRRDVRAEAIPLEKAAAVFRHLPQKGLS